MIQNDTVDTADTVALNLFIYMVCVRLYVCAQSRAFAHTRSYFDITKHNLCDVQKRIEVFRACLSHTHTYRHIKFCTNNFLNEYLSNERKTKFFFSLSAESIIQRTVFATSNFITGPCNRS